MSSEVAAAQREIAMRVVRRVRHQHQVRPVAFHRAQPAEGVIGPDIAVHHQEWPVAKQGQGFEDSTPGFKCLGLFVRPVNVKAPAGAVPQRRGQQVAEMTLVDDHFPESGSGQRFDVVLDKCLAAQLDQRLGQRIGQRAQALSATGGQDHGAHSGCSSN